MAFKANITALQKGFDTALTIAAQEKIYLASWSTRLSGNITGIDALEFLSNLDRVLVSLNQVKVLPGLQAYAQQQFGDAVYDVGAEFTSMLNALTSIQTWLKANVPANGVSISNGVLTGATYTPAQTTGLLTLVNAAAATIA